jgi:hypothetical protein
MDSTSPAPVLDESPPLDQSSLPKQRSPRPLFYASPPEDSSPPPAPETGEDGAAASSTGDPWSQEQDDEWSDVDPTSSPASSPEKPAALLSKAQMRATARTAVKVGTGMAHTVAAKTEAQQAVGLYLADDEDAAAIGDPLADVMHRRGDLVGGKLSPDANDFLRSMLGVAGYLAKQVQKIGLVRQIEAGQPAAAVQDFTGPDVAA